MVCGKFPVTEFVFQRFPNTISKVKQKIVGADKLLPLEWRGDLSILIFK